MREAVFRRYRRQLEENKPLPDLILIDGGKGQVAFASDAMRELDLEAIPLFGVVKPPRKHNAISHLLPRGIDNGPVPFDPDSAAFRLIQNIRDETHTTAVRYHQKRREIRDFTSELTAIEGVGEKRKMRLLRNLGSITKVAVASIEQLSPFVGKQTAARIVEHFERQRKLAPEVVQTEIPRRARKQSAKLVKRDIEENLEAGLNAPSQNYGVDPANKPDQPD
jgi:excinuclease ABC subunit C